MAMPTPQERKDLDREWMLIRSSVRQKWEPTSSSCCRTTTP